MQKIIIVIPTYNERENTSKMIETLAEEFQKIKDHEIELLYVDDTSPDKTYEVVQEKMKKYKWLHLLLNKEKKGLGVAYSKGFRYAMDELKADYVMEFDSDFQHRPDEIKKLVDKIDEGYDYIIGSRYIPGGSIPKEWGLNRKLLSVVGNLVARVGLLMPQIHDVTTGFKLARVKGVLDKVDLEHLYSNSFAYKVHILAQIVNGGAKVTEVPITFMARTKGESKIIKNEMNETLKVIFLFQIHNPKLQRFFKFGIVGFIGYVINALGLEFFSHSGITGGFASTFLAFQGGLLSILAQQSAWAASLAAEMAIISNFVLNNLWTFSEVKITSPVKLIRKFFEFNLTSLGAIVIQFIVIGLGTLIAGDTRLTRQILLLISMPLVLTFNFTMYNLVIWKTWKMPSLSTR
ncbi:glycosyltransferase family 2 protein [Candidatus Woesebacteria bacterium]|nr:glycosyltransferase family 2 protein [Candidatus Woesebacteria bacterium]